MEYKGLVEHLNEWNENLISELCADDILTCDELCGCTGDCIVVQAATAITDLLARAEAAEARCKLAEKCFDYSALHACETQLELEKKARAEAEAMAEKAKRAKNRYKACVYHSRPCELCKKYSEDWTPECCKCENSSKEYHPLFELKEE